MQDHKRMTRKWGQQLANKIVQRLDEIRAAPNLDTMKKLGSGRCHELHGKHSRHLSLDLVHPDRLIFEPADDPPSLLNDGGIDWRSVRTVRILGVEDTHE